MFDDRFQILDMVPLVLFSQTQSSQFPVKPASFWTRSQEKDTITSVGAEEKSGVSSDHGTPPKRGGFRVEGLRLYRCQQ